MVLRGGCGRFLAVLGGRCYGKYRLVHRAWYRVWQVRQSQRPPKRA
jgi:hypothetical protein